MQENVRVAQRLHFKYTLKNENIIYILRYTRLIHNTKYQTFRVHTKSYATMQMYKSSINEK